MPDKSTERPRPPRTASPSTRIDHPGAIRWVPIAEMRIAPSAQRDFRETQARSYADDFDLDAIGYPVVNFRDGHWYVVDGQHRIAALRMMGWGDQQVECEAYLGLTESEEAELFLKRNNRRVVKAFDKFRVAVRAGRETETDVNRIVMAQGLKVSKLPEDGNVSAVSALVRIYGKSGPSVLARTLRIVRDAWAKDREGLRAEVLLGVSMVCDRYNGKVDDSRAVERLAKTPGGALGLVGKAKGLAGQRHAPLATAVAAEVVEAFNGGLPAKARLESFWK